jgi:hypothetical protein
MKYENFDVSGVISRGQHRLPSQIVSASRPDIISFSGANACDIENFRL